MNFIKSLFLLTFITFLSTGNLYSEDENSKSNPPDKDCKITDFTVDKNLVCIGTEVEFTVVTEPKDCEVKWEGGGNPASGTVKGENKKFKTKWTEEGTYTVKVTCGEETKELKVKVLGEGKLAVKPGSATIVIGDEEDFTGCICENGKIVDANDVKWSILSSSSPPIISLSTAGPSNKTTVTGESKGSATLRGQLTNDNYDDAAIKVEDGSLGCPTIAKGHKITITHGGQDFIFELDEAASSDSPANDGFCSYEVKATAKFPVTLGPVEDKDFELASGTLRFDYKKDSSEDLYKKITFSKSGGSHTFNKLTVSINSFSCSYTGDASSNPQNFNSFGFELGVNISELKIDRFKVVNTSGKILGQLDDGIYKIDWTWKVNVEKFHLYRTTAFKTELANGNASIGDTGIVDVTINKPETNPEFTMPKFGNVVVSKFSAKGQYNIFTEEATLKSASGTAKVTFDNDSAFEGKVDISLAYSESAGYTATMDTSAITMFGGKLDVKFKAPSSGAAVTLKLNSKFELELFKSSNTNITYNGDEGTASVEGMTCEYDNTTGLKTLKLASGKATFKDFEFSITGFEYKAGVISTAKAEVSFNNDPQVKVAFEKFELSNAGVKLDSGTLTATYDDNSGNNKTNDFQINVTFPTTGKINFKTAAAVTINKTFGFSSCTFAVDLTVEYSSSSYTPSGSITVTPTLTNKEAFNIRFNNLTGTIDLEFTSGSWLPEVNVNNLVFNVDYMMNGKAVVNASGSLVENGSSGGGYKIDGVLKIDNGAVKVGIGALTMEVQKLNVPFEGILSEDKAFPDMKIKDGANASATVKFIFGANNGTATASVNIKPAGPSLSITANNITFLNTYTLSVSAMNSNFKPNWALDSFDAKVNVSGNNLNIVGLKFVYDDDQIKELGADNVNCKYFDSTVKATKLHYKNNTLTTETASMEVGGKTLSITNLVISASEFKVDKAEFDLDYDPNSKGKVTRKVTISMAFGSTVEFKLIGNVAYKLMGIDFTLNKLDLTYTPGSSESLTGSAKLNVNITNGPKVWLVKLVSLQGDLTVNYNAGGSSSSSSSSSSTSSSIWDNVGFDFSNIKNFKAQLFKGGKPLATVSVPSLDSDGKASGSFTLEQDATFSTAAGTLKLTTLDSKLNYDMKAGTLDMTSGAIKFIMDNITGTTDGKVEFAGTYNKNQITTAISVSGKAFGCEIKKAKINSKLTSQLELVDMKGTVELSHGDIKGKGGVNLGPVNFEIKNRKLVDLSSKKGLDAEWKGFALKVNSIKYTEAELGFDASLTTKGLTLKVEGFKIYSSGSVDVDKVSGNINTAKLGGKVDASFSSDRFTGSFSARLKLQSEVTFKGTVDVGNHNKQFNFLYFSMEGKSSVSIPLGQTGLRVNGGQIEFGYNYTIQEVKNEDGSLSKFVATPQKGAVRLGVGIGLTDLSTKMFQFFVAFNIDISAAGPKLGVKAKLQVPADSPYYLTGELKATYFMEEGKVDGYVDSTVKLPPNDGEYLDLTGRIDFSLSANKYQIDTNKKRLEAKLFTDLNAFVTFELSGAPGQIPNGRFFGGFSWEPSFRFQFPSNFDAQTCDQAVDIVGRSFGISITAQSDIKGTFFAEWKNQQMTNSNINLRVNTDATLKCKLPHIFYAGNDCLKRFDLHLKGDGDGEYKNGRLTGSLEVTIKRGGKEVDVIQVSVK